MAEDRNRRILLIDDTPAIHEDFRKILVGCARDGELDDLEAAIFGRVERPGLPRFELDCALQGSEGLQMVQDSLAYGRPYAVAFVDMLMPPGWDGVETIVHLWEADPRIQVVICTAYTDHSWERVLERLEVRDQLLILKKPCETVEVFQLANALTAKWQTSRQAELKMAELEELVRLRTGQLRSLNLDLLRARDEAEAANRVKSEFLANMSHEIRTPMNTVLGMTDLTLLTELTPTQKLFLGKARAAADSLMGVMEHILDYSAIESGSLALQPREFLLQQVLDRLSEGILERTQLKELELSIDPAPEPLLPLVGDMDRLRQVLGALLDNAVKFTGSGRVSLRVTVEERLRDRVTLGFCVCDTGIGIEEGDVERLFLPFSQLDTSTTRNSGGAGLGLAIASRLVELMGGELAVQSEPGRGSEFSFRLRFGTGSVAQAAQAAATSAFTDRPGITVAAGLRYCCDDPALYRSLLVKFLERREAASRIAQALAAGGSEDAVREAHTMISVAGTIGAKGLAEAARALERELSGGDGSAVAPVFSRFERELSLVVASIGNMVGGGDADPQLKELADPQRVRDMLEEMTRLFDYDLDRSLALKQLLHSELQGTALAAEFARMQRLIDSFDFDGALRSRDAMMLLLEKIATRKTVVDGGGEEI